MVSTANLIILDRDGVINYDSDAYIKHPDEWQPIPNSLAAIAQLKNNGYRVVIATNQSGIARGLYTEEILDQIHQKMHAALAEHQTFVDGIYYCPHGPNDNCACRKPEPGLFRQIANAFECSLQNVPVVGDSLRDLEAGCAMGCRPILVKTGKGADTLAKKALPPATRVFDDLMAFVRDFLAYDAKHNTGST